MLDHFSHLRRQWAAKAQSFRAYLTSASSADVEEVIGKWRHVCDWWSEWYWCFSNLIWQLPLMSYCKVTHLSTASPHLDTLILHHCHHDLSLAALTLVKVLLSHLKATASWRQLAKAEWNSCRPHHSSQPHLQGEQFFYYVTILQTFIFHLGPRFHLLPTDIHILRTQSH